VGAVVRQVHARVGVAHIAPELSGSSTPSIVLFIAVGLVRVVDRQAVVIGIQDAVTIEVKHWRPVTRVRGQFAPQAVDAQLVPFFARSFASTAGTVGRTEPRLSRELVGARPSARAVLGIRNQARQALAVVRGDAISHVTGAVRGACRASALPYTDVGLPLVSILEADIDLADEAVPTLSRWSGDLQHLAEARIGIAVPFSVRARTGCGAVPPVSDVRAAPHCLSDAPEGARDPPELDSPGTLYEPIFERSCQDRTVPVLVRNDKRTSAIPFFTHKQWLDPGKKIEAREFIVEYDRQVIPL